MVKFLLNLFQKQMFYYEESGKVNAVFEAVVFCLHHFKIAPETET